MWEDIALKKCSQCLAAYYCGIECQRAARPVHKSTCIDLSKGLVKCVLMRNPYDFTEISLTIDDPRFEVAYPSPIMTRMGIPLCMYPIEPGSGNQWATLIMADFHSGFAPPPFADLGTVILLRRDRLPLIAAQVYQLGAFFVDLMYRFGGEDDSKIDRSRAAFLHILARNNRTPGAWAW
jgi:MYND finger